MFSNLRTYRDNQGRILQGSYVRTDGDKDVFLRDVLAHRLDLVTGTPLPRTSKFDCCRSPLQSVLQRTKVSSATYSPLRLQRVLARPIYCPASFANALLCSISERFQVVQYIFWPWKRFAIPLQGHCCSCSFLIPSSSRTVRNISS